MVDSLKVSTWWRRLFKGPYVVERWISSSLHRGAVLSTSWRTALYVVELKISPSAIPPPGLPMLRSSACLSPGGLRRVRGIMSTTNLRKYMYYQQLPKTGNYYFLGKNYQAESRVSIPFCLKKTGMFPMKGQLKEAFSRFQLGRERPQGVFLRGVLS